MKKFLMIAAAAVGATLISAAPAEARDGCGPGGHRGPGGYCRPNRGPGYGYGVRRGPPVIGVYYGGRGYWDGRGYRPNRYRYRGGWRYR